jgi:hypothetical protein
VPARLLRPLSRRMAGGASGAAAREALLPKRLDAVESERELLRIGLVALRALVPSASGVALFALPSSSGGSGGGNAGSDAAAAGCSVEAFSSRLDAGARSALRDALRRVSCEDPSTSVAFLCAASAQEDGTSSAGTWAAADSRDWPDGAASFSDWAAAAGEDARASSVCFLTLAIAPTGGGRRKPAVAAALLRFENHKYSRAMSWLAAATGSSLFASALSTPPLPRDAAPLHRFCGAVGDALAARRDKAAAAALLHVNALARDIYPENLVGKMIARHSSINPVAAAVAGGALVAQDMLCESHESVTIVFADVVGWTGLAGGMSPETAMALLDRLWQRLDTLSVAHGVYKARACCACVAWMRVCLRLTLACLLACWLPSG